MNFSVQILGAVLLFCGATLAHPADLICCGGSKVTVRDLKKPDKPSWSWEATDSPSIPTSLHQAFRSTDECKPYSGGLLLITASSGGVALIEREGKRCRFLASARNAHSACLLPRHQLVVAASFGGDELQFFSRGDVRRPAVPVQRIRLVGAHGSVWDAQRNCLWALGDVELLRLQSASDGRWSVKERWDLPSRGGHDLSPHDDTNLFVTSSTQVFLFDRDRGLFSVHQSIGDRSKVKSVDRDPKTGAVVFHQGTATTWWSDTIRFLGRPAIHLADTRLYKVRWDRPIAVPGRN